MGSTLRTELKQKKSFQTLEEEIFLSVLRTADHLLWGEIEVLRAAELTFPQYNVLRILRGAGPTGLSGREISERMVTRDSDITRLLDRLEARGLVARDRHPKDRRIILPKITKAGLTLLERLDGPVERVHRQQLRHMNKRQLQSLRDLLQLARGAGGQT